MKVIDLQLYRTRRDIRMLEKRVGELALNAQTGSVREIKTCFKEWLKINTR